MEIRPPCPYSAGAKCPGVGDGPHCRNCQPGVEYALKIRLLADRFARDDEHLQPRYPMEAVGDWGP